MESSFLRIPNLLFNLPLSRSRFILHRYIKINNYTDYIISANYLTAFTPNQRSTFKSVYYENNIKIHIHLAVGKDQNAINL